MTHEAKPLAVVVRRRLEVTGIVQGVGFRPFVYRLATGLGLTGHVLNHDAGVTIEVEGPTDAVAQLADRLRTEAPPLARIDTVVAAPCAPRQDDRFRIVASASHARATTLISPDVAVCDDCLAELRDPRDRRYRYPFINCVNCGPRYTIIADLPYDRAQTTMRAFTMCAACQAEYDDPASRRFHAQPNACPACGPRLALWDGTAGGDGGGAALLDDDPIAVTVAHVRRGQIVALKGLGGFHLACDASREDVVATLRRRKHRDEKPLAIMVADLEQARAVATITADEAAALQSPARPIVLVARRPGSVVAEGVAPGNRRVGLMLPYTPLHHLILERGAGFGGPLVMTSANLSEEPIIKENDEARARLAGIADLFVTHDRDILARADDSVLQVAAGRARHLRRSRGFVPVPVPLPCDGPSVLAVGGELKNTICLTRGREAFLSPHVGDLEQAATSDFFEETVAHLQQVLAITPEVVVHDLHPDYHATRFARALARAPRPGSWGDRSQTGGEDPEALPRSGGTGASLPCFGVQHHHAHILACLAEHGVDAPCIGLALDGTGMGLDGTLWGGEILLVNGVALQRAAAWRAVPLPGGDQAARQAWRMGLALLVEAGAASRLDELLPRWPEVDPDQARALRDLLGREHPFPRTSGVGRLFDGVAALLGLCARSTFEGQAAMTLEHAATWSPAASPYPVRFLAGGRHLTIDSVALVSDLLDDLNGGVAVPQLAARFHATVVEALVTVATRLKATTEIATVALGGGVFQNRILLEATTARLEAAGFRTLAPAQVPANDGGLALGQAYFGLLSMQ